MSPEQALDEEPLGPRSDQYSLACVVHEMLAGEPLFSARSARALLFTHSACEPPRIRDFRPELPPAVEDVTLKALSKSPDERFSSVIEFSEALAEASRERKGYPAPSVEEDPAPGRGTGGSLEYRFGKTMLEHLGWLTMGVLALGIALIVVAILVNLWVLTPGTP
jgi:serine/threonine-protein kinase